MKNLIKYLMGFIFFSPVICCSQSNKNPYSETIRPNIKAKLDSLYPKATLQVVLNDKYVSDSTQVIEVTCHCDETSGMIIMTFDTNGNFLNKEVHYHSQKNLPEAIVKYVQKNTNDSVKFAPNYMEKYYNNKGEVSYGIMEDYSPNDWTYQGYMLKFKPDGELISKEALPHYGR